MREQELYEISSLVAKIINIYANDTYFSVISTKIISKHLIQKEIQNLMIYLDKKPFKNFFQLNGKKRTEDIIVAIINGYERFTKAHIEQNNGYEKLILEDSVNKYLNFNDFYGISGEQRDLIFLMKYINRHKKYFKIVLINGSIGSRDYKPGWSDIDLFLIIKNKFLKSVKELKKLRKITLTIKKYLYKFSILQLHGVFYATESHLNANFNEFFPIPCIETGQLILESNNVELFLPSNQYSAIKYFEKIYESSKKLLYESRIRPLSIHSQIMLFHRIYSFPFSFLQCFNENVGKKESFEKISSQYQSIFPEISEFYQEVNKMYLRWNIKKIGTYKTRKFLGRFFSLDLLNLLFLRCEKDIIKRIYSYYEEYCNNGIFDRFNKYLDIASDYIGTHNESYKIPINRFLKPEFYESSIDKVKSTFINQDSIISLNKFGSINAPGNSDIDLIFVLKDKTPYFNQIIKQFTERFTDDEKYVVFQHVPFIIPEKIAPYLNYILPCNNISPVFGKEIEFREMKNPYSKFYLLVELLVFYSPLKFPSTINHIAEIRTHLQRINTTNFMIKLFNEIVEKFQMNLNIEFSKCLAIFSKNDYIRKNMYNLKIDGIKKHINNAYWYLNSILLQMRNEIASFIETRVLKESVVELKKGYPLFRLNFIYFIGDDKKWQKIYNSRYQTNYYVPWAFYFFFKHKKLLKKEFYDGVVKRDLYLNYFLNYTSKYNESSNLYTPFWYLNKMQMKVMNIMKFWDIIPKYLIRTRFFFLYFWEAIRKLGLKLANLNINFIKYILNKLKQLFT